MTDPEAEQIAAQMITDFAATHGISERVAAKTFAALLSERILGQHIRRGDELVVASVSIRVADDMMVTIDGRPPAPTRPALFGGDDG